jgi:membrane associated rhomboid family serine protease
MAEAAPVMYCYRHPERETGLSCSECGRPICTECMTIAPVGLRCPEHSGKAQGTARITRNVKRASFEGTGALVTKSLIAANVLVFLINLAQGASLSQNAGSLYEKGVLVMRAVDSSGQVVGLAEGEYWRLLSAAFLHGSIIHLGLNMLMLWWIGAPMEAVVGRGRFLAIYLVSGLAGSAGALVASPNAITVGASGAIFGILGAALVFERQRTYVLGGSALSIILLNLVFTFAVPNISIGGHVGGLAGGVLSALAITRLGRVHAAYGRPGLLGMAGVVAVGLLSVLVAYMKVQQYV